MALDKLFDDEKQAVSEIGEAMQLNAFFRLIEVLEQYELRILTNGIEDPDVTKDYLRGAVHCARTLRTSLLAAKEYHDSELRREAAAVKARRESDREFLPPGSGTGGMS